MSMRRLLDIGLERLRGLIGDMLSVSEDALRKAIEGILIGENRLKEVKKLSDQLLFMMDEVSELAVELIARFQPVASDLREIKSIIQVSYDFSRIGRYAVNICEVPAMIPGSLCELTQLKKLSDIVVEMVDEAGRALITGNLEMARRVRRRDDEVDQLYAEYLKSLLKLSGKADPACIVSSAFVLRYLERIADHACYIADALIYARTGRHELEGVKD